MEDFYEEGTITDLRPKLREYLSDLSYQEQDEVILLIKPLLPTVNPPLKEGETRDPSLTQKDIYYKVHYSDLYMLREAVGIATGIVGALSGAFPGISLGLIGFGLVALLFQYRRNRFILDGKQALVLNTLKEAPMPGWTVKQLATQLPVKPWLEEPEIESVLKQLSSILKENGKEDPLVIEKNGIWRAIDVSFT